MINISFDRRLTLSPQVGRSIQLHCRSILEAQYTVFELPARNSRMVDNGTDAFLAIDVAGTRNDKTRECDVIIGSRALRDRDHVYFGGLEHGAAMVTLADSVSPVLVGFDPPNSEVGVSI